MALRIGGVSWAREIGRRVSENKPARTESGKRRLVSMIRKNWLPPDDQSTGSMFNTVSQKSSMSESLTNQTWQPNVQSRMCMGCAQTPSSSRGHSRVSAKLRTGVPL